MGKSKSKKSIAFEFVLDELGNLPIHTKAMFGCTAIYLDHKILLILRSRPEHLDDNGVWLATAPEHHASLKKEFPSMRSIRIFGPVSAWQVLPADSDDFEESVRHACELIMKSDQRIGRIPKQKGARKAPQRRVAKK